MKKNIVSPINKNIKFSIPSDLYNNIQTNEGISVICCTNKKDNIKNILYNFLSQTYKKKELIIILNHDNPDMNKWKKETSSYNNIQIYKLSSKHSLGKCLNYAVNTSRFLYVAKFDDDDYYAPNYLCDMVKPFYFTNASIVGKATTYVYFSDKKILAIRNINKENRYVNRVDGPTLMFKKSISPKIQFQDKNLGEDIEFCNDCIKNGFKIYSTNKDNFVYIRSNENKHTWKIDNDYFFKKCTTICKTDDFKKYI